MILKRTWALYVYTNGSRFETKGWSGRILKLAHLSGWHTSNGGRRGNGHSSWSRCSCGGKKFLELLEVLDRTCKVWLGWSNPKQRTHSVLFHYRRLGSTAARAHHQVEKVHGSQPIFRKMLQMVQEVPQRRPQLATIRNRHLHNKASIFRVFPANPENGVRNCSTDIDALKENRSSCPSRERQ